MQPPSLLGHHYLVNSNARRKYSFCIAVSRYFIHDVHPQSSSQQLNTDNSEDCVKLKMSRYSPEILALVPKKSQGWEPLCAFYRQEIKIELEKIIYRGDRSFQKLLTEILVKPLSIDSQTAKMLFNCNTPLDLDLDIE